MGFLLIVLLFLRKKLHPGPGVALVVRVSFVMLGSKDCSAIKTRVERSHLTPSGTAVL